MILTHGETVLAQATGMVSVQADCSIEEALRLIRQHATESARHATEVAESIVDRHLRVEAHA